MEITVAVGNIEYERFLKHRRKAERAMGRYIVMVFEGEGVSCYFSALTGDKIMGRYASSLVMESGLSLTRRLACVRAITENI